MLIDIEWPGGRAYDSGSDWEPIQFYLEALNNSLEFNLLLGYFSSAAISVLSLGFANFLSGGGKLKMVINDVLFYEDKEVLKNLSDGHNYQIPFDLSNISALQKTLNDYDLHFFECLGWLIQNQRIEIRIIRPLGKKGISHYKSGLFYDGVTKIGFSGSCNFTAFGFLENLERIDTFLPWDDQRASNWIIKQQLDFDNIFNGNADHIEYLTPNDVETAIRDTFGSKNLEQLLLSEKSLLEKKHQLFEKGKIKNIIISTEKKIQSFLEAPKFPFPSGPREYQQEAYENWVKNGFRGIFAMATGTGKTITSLNCLLQESKKNQESIYHAIILVPTITLVNQWEREAKSFKFDLIIKVSSKDNWEFQLATILSTNKRVPTSFIIITTYASFVKDRFQKQIKHFPSDLVLIADEAHNIGSPSVLKHMSALEPFKRIALSATPKRNYDPEGSLALETIFNDKEPYTYSFSMERAIAEKILCKYYYYPQIIELTNSEFQEYLLITKQLARFYSPKDGISENDSVKKLLLKRKRIIQKAENKLQAMRTILINRFQKEGNLLYTFVYVPEGVVIGKDVSEEDIPSRETEEEDLRIINQYTKAIAEISSNIMVNQFTSSLKDRDAILDQFKLGKIQVIASMKCLDEGVDIPRAEYAIFCSSTGNPRQFIQRRGRILRQHPDKQIATIHDLVVVPNLSNENRESATFQTEKNMVKTELERVMYFASLASNPHFTEKVFQSVCDHYDLSLSTILQNLK